MIMPQTTASQDRKFLESVISSRLLEDSIDWIKDNLEPEDVFSKQQLREWATENGFVEEN